MASRNYRAYADRVFAAYGVSPRTRSRYRSLGRDDTGTVRVTPAEVDELLAANVSGNVVERQALRDTITGLADIRRLAATAHDDAIEADVPIDYSGMGVTDLYFRWLDDAEFFDIVLPDRDHGYWGYHRGSAVI